MSETSSGPTWPDWQDDHAYAFSTHLPSRGWAWEFLRRNPVFQKDLAAVLRRANCSELLSQGVRRLPASAVDLSPWSLLFCKLDRD